MVFSRGRIFKEYFTKLTLSCCKLECGLYLYEFQEVYRTVSKKSAVNTNASNFFHEYTNVFKDDIDILKYKQGPTNKNGDTLQQTEVSSMGIDTILSFLIALLHLYFSRRMRGLFSEISSHNSVC
jgi:hypothetical protein